jgi:hypothetical protein
LLPRGWCGSSVDYVDGGAGDEHTGRADGLGEGVELLLRRLGVHSEHGHVLVESIAGVVVGDDLVDDKREWGAADLAQIDGRSVDGDLATAH